MKTGSDAMTGNGLTVLDPDSIRRQFMRRAKRIAEGEFLLREIERRMFERLELVRLQPARLLDIGCGQGQGLAKLSLKYPQALALGVDFALPMLKRHQPPGGFVRGLVERLPVSLRSGLDGLANRSAESLVCADGERLPLAGSSVDLIWSNLCWHWLVNPVDALQDWYRVIRPGGLLMFSSFGVDTGKELRELGWPVPQFPDMHDVGDALARNGFADPVMDSERLTLEYRSATRLMAELSALGGNAALERRAHLTSRAEKVRWLKVLEKSIEDRGGVFRVSVEVVYGHAWCAANKKLPAGYSPVNWVPANETRNRPRKS